MDKINRMGLSQDDDNRLVFLSGDEFEDDAGSVVVVNSNVDLLISKDGMIAPVGYSYTGKLAFLCFGPVSKFYPPILSTGGSMNLSIVERQNGSCVNICKIQEEKATLEWVTGNAQGIIQQNQMQFGLMAQNEDSASQAHRDLRVVTIMKRAELTQKMIQMKMTMWEKMVDGVAKERMYESIHDFFVKSDNLETQLQEVGSEERVCNPIVLSVLSNVATSMGLSSLKTLKNSKGTLHILMHRLHPPRPLRLVNFVRCGKGRNSARPRKVTVVNNYVNTIVTNGEMLPSLSYHRSSNSLLVRILPALTNVKNESNHIMVISLQRAGPPRVVCNIRRLWLHVKLNVRAVWLLFPPRWLF